LTPGVSFAARLVARRTALGPATVVWVSWLEKASGVPRTVTEDRVRARVLPPGFVGVRRFAVEPVTSGSRRLSRRGLRAA
jgi:hypothetical protein